MRMIVALCVSAALILGSVGCNRSEEKVEQTTLTIFHAGSLSVPLKEISALFEKENPGIKILAEAAGSRECARKISELGRACDIMASADYMVVNTLLMPEHADFNVLFALNEMAIAYTPKSKFADKITSENWHEILLTDGVAFGRAEPESDPCGYRTLMAFQLAEKHYGIPGLAARLTEKDGKRYMRPKETDLLALLEAGEIDYLFIYRSVCVQHDLKAVALPGEVNLGKPELAPTYSIATVQLTGKEAGSVITQKGEPMVYSVTIPKNAPNRKAAEAWLALLLSDRGRAIMEKQGQGCPAKPSAIGFDNLTENLKSLCVPFESKETESAE